VTVGGRADRPGGSEDPYFRIYGDYPRDRPVFYPREACPWLATLEAHWTAVRREYEAYRRDVPEVPRSFIPDDVAPQRWRSVNFVTYGHRYRGTCARFPETVALLGSIPWLTTAFIALLEPHAELHPHNGDTDTTYRAHLGLVIPGDAAACGLEVAGERTGWREGAAFAFNEAHRHRVWNRTDRERVVLVVDVLRPEYRARMLPICGDVLGAITLMMLETAVPPLRRLPAPVRRSLHRGLGLAARAVLRARDGVGRAPASRPATVRLAAGPG